MSHPLRPSGPLLGAMTTLCAAGLLWGLDARRRTRRAAVVHRTMVDLLLNTLCAGDAATARHSRRVADLTDVVGRTWHRGREASARLRVGALLHDLGKLDDNVVPLVRKARKLSDSERSRMEHHTNESADILQPLERIHPGISLIVESHHERWDGEGYPQGLAGTEIPLESRIIAVADVFDAMTQDRSYREGIDPEEVLATIREDAGTKFDPEVVARLGRPEVWREWVAIAEEGRRAEAQEARSEPPAAAS